MSAQAYTNRRRILAEASIVKVQFPKGVASHNKLTPTINCNQSFENIVYTPVCVCPFNGYGNAYIPPQPPPLICIPTYDGGYSTTESGIVYDGASIGNYPILSGGALADGCANVYVLEEKYDGGNIATNSPNILPGINVGAG